MTVLFTLSLTQQSCYFFMSAYQGQHKNTKLRANKVTSRAKEGRRERGGRKPCLIKRSYRDQDQMIPNDGFCCSNMKSNIHWRIFSPDLTFGIPIGLILISWEQPPASQRLHLQTIMSIWFGFISIWVQNKYIVITELQHFLSLSRWTHSWYKFSLIQLEIYRDYHRFWGLKKTQGVLQSKPDHS